MPPTQLRDSQYDPCFSTNHTQALCPSAGQRLGYVCKHGVGL
jgi:hypothetical protein